MKQTQLVPQMIDEKSPKFHRIRKQKNTGSEDFYSDDQSFAGIMQKAKDLGRDTFIALYSGGKDSGKVLDLLQKREEVDGVLHLNTHTGVKVTLDFVKDECTRRGLKLYIRHPTPLAYAYVAYCLEFGFPGPKLHAAIMKILKWSSMQKFIQEPRFKKKHPALVGGVRKFESIERMGNYDAPITRERDMWFVNPIFYESDEEVYRYFIENNLKRTPAYETLGFSGECNCGSFAQYDEAKRLEQTDPDVADMMKWIEEGIRRWGTPQAKKYGKWGRGKYGMKEASIQKILGRFFTKDEMDIAKRIEAVTCGSECGASTMKGMFDIKID